MPKKNKLLALIDSFRKRLNDAEGELSKEEINKMVDELTKQLEEVQGKEDEKSKTKTSELQKQIVTTVSQLDMTEVRRIIAEVLKLPESLVFDANNMQDVSKLDKFITVLNVSQSDIGTEIKFKGADEVEIASTLCEVTISVNAYGKNAYDMLCQLTESMRFTVVWQRLKRLRMGYLRCSKIRSLPTAIAGGKEQRAQVDLIFSINPIVKSPLNRGDTVKFNLEKGL